MMSANPARRTAPPVYTSHSLEGMEQVVPPRMMYFTQHRSEILFNKPLPGRPVPIMMIDSPTESGMYSDSDSDTESTLDDSLQSPSVYSSYSRDRDFPVFVRSNSDDFTDLEDHPNPADHAKMREIPIPSPLKPHHPPARTDVSPINASPVSVDIDATSVILGTSAHYGRPVDWTRKRIDSSHYFREKTWDFFPELATPTTSTRQSSGRKSPASSSRSKEGRLNVSAKQPKWYSKHRDSIKSYVNKTLTRDQDAEERDNPLNVPRHPPSRRYTAPMGPLSAHPPSITGDGDDDEYDDEPELDEFHAQLVATSTASSSRTGAFEQPRSSPDAPKEKRRGSMFKRMNRATTSPEYFANATLPLASPTKINRRQTLAALQTSFDDAKKRMTETPDDRRREQLKSQIKFIGAVNPHLCAPQPDPWSP
ncbi:hypothetical protein N7466_005514 [Penicillium verhagenii]|uniref:uncharacterized protein n=1 Tax=Penicillium verhagenii TaxID=1562060 RepID=UPI00254588EC|nr:uncharacterized protein N7466_005514 [Penicillium verhagenii]KAJ5930021.1 hypothetical protein N7466_005514 [Penicillium verhagenii]